MLQFGNAFRSLAMSSTVVCVLRQRVLRLVKPLRRSKPASCHWALKAITAIAFSIIASTLDHVTLRRMPQRQRDVAELLSTGESTQTAAKLFRLPMGAQFMFATNENGRAVSFFTA